MKAATLLAFNIQHVSIAKVTPEVNAAPSRTLYEVILESRSPEPPENREQWKNALSTLRTINEPDLGPPRKNKPGEISDD